MAEENAPKTGPVGGFWNTFKQPLLGVPVYIWFALGVIVLALILKRVKAKRAASGETSATGLPVGASATDMNAASQLANTFFAAGVMPYQGGDVFVNGTSSPATPDKPLYNTMTQVVDVTRGETIGNLVKAMQKYNPGLGWADIWALNPNLVSQGGLTHLANGDWQFTAEATPVIISRPGLVSWEGQQWQGGVLNGVTTNTPNGPSSSFWPSTPFSLS